METTQHLPETDRAAKPVADAFLGQYYEVMERHPELVHKFYAESSVISRPGPEGSMSLVSTLKGIDDLIQSFCDEKESSVEINTADSQFTCGNGLMILVNGLIGSEELKKKFSQMFFLAPQERGYYVLNDVFRYIGEEVSAPVMVQKDSDSPATEEAELTFMKLETKNGKNNSESAVVDKEIIIEPKVSSGERETTLKSTSSNGLPNGKLSYAWMVKAAAPQSARTHVIKAAPPASSSSLVKESPNIIADDIKKPSQPSSDSDKKLSLPRKEYDQKVEDQSVSVWDLPMSIKPYQLDRIFSRKFGPVKQRGIQIRNTQGKNGPICYAFVEFESTSSADAAIKASPISIDSRPVNVKRKINRGKNEGKPSGHDGGAHGSRTSDARNNGNGNRSFQHDKARTSAHHAKSKIDGDGFQIVSRNGKWKTERF